MFPFQFLDYYYISTYDCRTTVVHTTILVYIVLICRSVNWVKIGGRAPMHIPANATTNRSEHVLDLLSPCVPGM